MLGKTPMMRQYQEIKARYPDTILFFRLGDFYEMFGPDAELASRELEITLTGRDAGLEARVPMCGVPYHAADNYIARLIQKGYKVAICEQIEDPRSARGIVRREVTRVITPGTVVESQMIAAQYSNYLAAVTGRQYAWGLAYCDVSTGDFYAAEFTGPDAENRLKDELFRLSPSEVLLPGEGIKDKTPAFINCPAATYLEKGVFSFRRASQILLEHFGVLSLESFGCTGLTLAVACAGAIIFYLQETQKASPRQIKTLKQYSPDLYLLIDSTTFRNLELTRTMRFNEKKGSLLEIMDKTKTAPGSRLLRQWLEKPLTDKNVLEERLSAVEVLTKQWSQRQTLRKLLEEIYDLERLMTRILYNRAGPRELVSLRNSLAVLPQIKNVLGSLEGSAYLKRLHGELETLDEAYRLLARAIEEDPPYNLNNGGVIRQGYDPQIDDLRSSSRHGKEWIARLESEEKEKTGIKSLKVGFNKVFGYYFEVTKANLSLVPEYFQRKQTLANGERYVTKELLELENQVLGAEEKLLARELEVYNQVLAEIGAAAETLQKTTQVLAQVDVLQSMAELAVQNDYVRPSLLDKEENRLFFRELRHPVVEKLSANNYFVPNDLQFAGDTSLCIITGPNMGGKSTYIRSVALAVVMAQAGSFVPAKEAVISLRDRVFARVGASDDLGSGQSTFMVEMNEVANILRNATPYSLVILDEVGRGTSTYDGLSMAWAVSEYLATVLKTKTLFATHYHELTRLEESYPSIKNLSASVREKGEEIIFLHKIVEGPADRSYGIQVGRLAGLPPEVIGRAEDVLNNMERRHIDGQDNPAAVTRPEQDKEKTAGFVPEDAAGSECLAFLEKMDLLNITPLEALNKLYQLQEMLKKERRGGVEK
ncbi:MAG: DNA mismatch repair protein MutS [Peptococcaceae bacterium]|nr:DNA mismatch repair protein MutS [Peptococcaceae bacterium]MDH7524134.1 DNA mismatch repair protein MutS [Peptococcaceae bacterium]